MKDSSIIKKQGKNPGKTVTVMAGIHGNEICGIKAIRKAIKEIKIENGVVYFIFANLSAIALDVRQTQMNLNRAFKPKKLLKNEEKNSYERKRAEELMPYLDKSNALLDIHSSMNPKSIPFIICEPHSFDIAKKLPFSIRSNGWDVIEEGGTDYYVNKNKLHGKGICVECGYHLDKKAPIRAYHSIEIFLGLMGNISLKKYRMKKYQREIYADYIYYTKKNFTLERKFTDFESIKKGTVIGRDGKREIKAKHDGVIIFPHNCNKKNKEAFIFGIEKK